MKKILIGNLKMNIVSEVERNNFFKSFRVAIKRKKFENVDIVICPPVIHLETFVKKIKNKKISFGAQNVYFEKEGSFTGEISPLMVKNFGGEYVIVGHSERRRIFGENDEIVGKKINAVLNSGLRPILCVGESLEERNEGKLKEVIENQIKRGLAGVIKKNISKIIVAYEPVWSIGSGKIPTTEEIMEAQILIKKILMTEYSLSEKKISGIIYGGSVNYKNVESVCLDAGMDGVLVGGESLHPVDFLKIAEKLDEFNSDEK